jgi:serine/threonine protein kinase
MTLSRTVWSLGCLLFSLLTLDEPYAGITWERCEEKIKSGARPSLSVHVAATPYDIQHDLLWKHLILLFIRCTMALPEQRPNTAQLLHYLQKIQESIEDLTITQEERILLMQNIPVDVITSKLTSDEIKQMIQTLEQEKETAKSNDDLVLALNLKLQLKHLKAKISNNSSTEFE